MTTSSDQERIKIFISCVQEDRLSVRKMEDHLQPLVRQNIVSIWHQEKMTVGGVFSEEINQHLQTAQLILLFVSPDYLASDRSNEEVTLALDRYNKGLARVVPVILRPCLWNEAPFATLQAIPTGARPVSSWPDPDEAFFDITRHIQLILNEILRPEAAVLEPSGPPLNESTASPGGNRTAQAIIRQGRFEKDAIAKNITADIPIQDLDEDQLGFDVYALAFGDFIASQETSTPLTIGIHGPWGSGKSSLMRMVQKQLDSPLTLGERWTWLAWLFFFSTTLPVWLLGQLVLWIGYRLKVEYTWFQKLSKDLTFDPENPATYTQNAAQDASQPLRFWQRISKRHRPRNPLTHPTVWFNAWKFDQEEQLWAALALEVLNQIQKKYNFFQRSIFGLSLAGKRLSFASFLKVILLPLLLACVYWIYTSYMKVLPHVFLPVFGYQLPVGQALLSVGIVLSVLIPIVNLANDPFQMNVKNVFDRPDYKDKIGFIGSFAEDFSHIVALITKARPGWKARKLVIFIDDLDRCQAPKAADIVEGINLFLDSRGCIFVLGMDTMAVIASIETKYKDIFEKIRQENVAVISPGRLFLDKIIQVPFQVPPPTPEGMTRLINTIIHPEFIVHKKDLARARPQNRPLSPDRGTITGEQNTEDQIRQGAGETQLPPVPLVIKATQPDPASYKLADVSAAIEEGAQYLPENPRQIKRFINLFRLYVYIVDARRLLRFGEDDTGTHQMGVTLKRLAIWVAWSMRWPEIAQSLQEEAQLSREELRAYLMDISHKVQEDGSWAALNGANDWSAYNGFLNTVVLKQEAEKNSTSRWCYFPWHRWLLEKDFLKCIKDMESFWAQPDATNGDDWLHIMLTMNRATFATSTNIDPADNEKLVRTGKLAE